MATEGNDAGYLEAAREHHDHAVQGASGSARNGGRPASGATSPWTWAWRDARWDAGAEWDAATAIGATWSASYDAAGEMTYRAASGATTCAGSSSTGTSLAYGNQGRLASWQNTPSAPTSTDRFLYDGEGQRVEQVASSGGTTTTTVYVGGLEEIATTNGVSTTTASYGGLALSGNGVLSYTLSDGLGSVSEAVSTSGSVTATQLYGPYGAVRYSSGSLPTNKGYTGQRADVTTGLDYYSARYYDPLAGQFASADTTYAGGFDLFGYVGGGPETWNDPSGHRPSGSGPDDCLTSIPCITVFLNFFITLLTNGAGAQPFTAKLPDGFSMDQFGSNVVRPEPSFTDEPMQDLAELGSLFNDNGQLVGGNSNVPDSGNGANGQFQNDEETAYTQAYSFVRFVRKIRGDDDPNDSNGPNHSGSSSASGANGKSGMRRATATRPSAHGSAVPYIDTVDTSPAPASAPSFWDDVVSWWNNIWEGSPAPAPCACGGPLDTNPEDNPEVSPEDPSPELPWFGGIQEHWQRHWNA